ncbi:MAG: ergothioneine biosynthesis protein EgtB [Oceanicaulis sp.]
MPKDVVRQDAAALRARFDAVRARSVAWAAPLSAEDLCVQTMADVSPGKWHLAHTTWFWETFLLKPGLDGYAEFDPRFCFLFNSYYEAIGERHARPERGFLTRPSIEEVLAYRSHVDGAVRRWFEKAGASALKAYAEVVLTGFAHEEQHQELFLTDIKHVLSANSFPETAYKEGALSAVAELTARPPDPDWVAYEGGLCEFGHAHEGFAFDNEGPAHKAWLEPFALASRPVSNAEYLAFIEDGGYERPEFWLADGWAEVQERGRRAPFYWREIEDGWREFTLHGLEPIDPDAPVSHVDYFEASAFAAWSGFRLPEEREWERAAASYDAEAGRWTAPGARLHPTPADGPGPLYGLFGEVWEWTRSAYSPYPGYRAPTGAIGEYNGKFMCGQFVLRGGSALTQPGHVRASYRNFFYPGSQWQMTGLRLARDV